MRRTVPALAVTGLLTVLLAACSGNTAANTSSQSGGFSMQTQGAQRGGEARVSVQAQSGAVVTVISELAYDAGALTMKQCSIDAAGAAGKSLSVAEPSPGKVRAVLAGTMDPLAAGADVLSCTFTVADSASGKTSVSVKGETSDASFNESTFSVDGTIQIGS